MDLGVDNMSDEELQEALAAGLLKPGLNIPFEKKLFKNNTNGLKSKLEDFLFKTNWIEKMDLISKAAPMDPEMFGELSKEESSDIVKFKNRLKFSKSKDVVVDDFKREMLFHRQAQSAVLEGISRLKSLGIPTRRPDDYFAEMAKSDQHMHKVRENLAARQAAAVRAEKISNLRRMKKLGKQTQIVNKQKKNSERKKMLNEVKKFRKGVRSDLDFLDDKDFDKKSDRPSKRSLQKRAHKNEKFGFGGKKRGSKRNTKDSAAFMGGYNKKGKGKKPGGRKNKRPGKGKRIKKRAKK